MTDPNNAVIWIFLVFFVLTGLVTLAALPKNGLLQLRSLTRRSFCPITPELSAGLSWQDALASRSARRDVSHMVVDYSQGWHAR